MLRSPRLRLSATIALSLLLLASLFGRNHLRAFVMMSCITWPETPLRAITPPVSERKLNNASLPGRLYLPNDSHAAPGIVLIHGVHRAGYDDYRLTNAARSIAAMGVVVYTPHIPDLAAYKVTPESVNVIGSAAQTLRSHLGRPVGIMAMSFSGGLALMAAADSRYAPHISFVWAIGAHHDMARVGRFFATNESPRPDGTILKMPAHEYGALVLIYSHPEDFFTSSDLPAAREAIRLLLREEWNASHDAAKDLSPAGQKLMQSIYDKDRSSLREPLLASVARHESEYAAVSPSTVLKDIRVPVILIHGAGDDVIPPSETEWLARDIPPQYVHESLISPAISHVGVGNKPRIADQFRLLNAMAHLLKESEGH